MEQIELNVEPRTIVGKGMHALRRSGYVPLVAYGPGFEPMNLQAEARHLRRVLVQAGSTHLITVKVDGRSFLAQAREIQRHSIRGDFVHCDLYAVDITKTLRADVPLAFDGVPEEVRTGRAVLTHAITDIEVECLPTQLPPAVHVDMSVLKAIGDAIHVRDLKPIPGVAFLDDPEELVVKISPLAAQPVEEVAQPEAPAAEVEVIRKGKEEKAAEGETPAETKKAPEAKK